MLKTATLTYIILTSARAAIAYCAQTSVTDIEAFLVDFSSGGHAWEHHEESWKLHIKATRAIVDVIQSSNS